MSSTGFNFGMTTKEFLDEARRENFKVIVERVGRDRTRIHISHPLLKDARDARSPTHGEVNGHLVRFASSCVKQLRRLAKDTAAPPPAPSEPAPAKQPEYALPSTPDAPEVAEAVQEMTEAERDKRAVEHAADTLAVWLEDEVKAGLRQFTLVSIVNRRKHLGIPESEAVHSALNLLARRKILGMGAKKSSGRSYRGYRINPQFTNGSDLSICEAYETDKWKTLKEPPAYDENLPEKEKKPKATPPKKAVEAPKEQAMPTEQAGDFTSALVQDALQDPKKVMLLVDLYITSGQYKQLAELLIRATDIEWCEKVLRRVAEIAPQVKK